MPLVLANRKSDAAHSLTCDIEPGELSTSSVAMVWIESITISSGVLAEYE